MDVGCYAIHGLRSLRDVGGGEPSLVAATAAERPGSGGVDEQLEATIRYPRDSRRGSSRASSFRRWTSP